MSDNLRQASELVEKLQALAKQMPLPRPNLPRSGDEVVIDQLAVFGELQVVLARYMDKAQRTIKWLTWVLTVLTALLVFEAAPRLEKLLLAIYHQVRALL
jgi:hypothetical protein